MLISREDLRSQLKNNEFAPVYLLFGAETFLRDSAAKAITERAMKDAQLREFNETSFSINSTDIQQAIASAEQLPMIATRRVVKISEINKLKEADEDVLARYVVRPVPSSVVILVADDLDKRRKLTKLLFENCASIEFAPLPNNELINWARRTLKELRCDIEEKALHHLIGLVGSDVRVLTNEVNKLATAALSSSNYISFELVEQLVPNTREMSNFELTDYLVAKKRAKSLQILKKLFDDGAEPLMLLGLIGGNYRRLALVKEMMKRGAANDEVFKTVAMPYSKRDEFLAVARRANNDELSNSLTRIAEADLAIKTSQGTPRMQIEMLVVELTKS